MGARSCCEPATVKSSTVPDVDAGELLNNRSGPIDLYPETVGALDDSSTDLFPETGGTVVGGANDLSSDISRDSMAPPQHTRSEQAKAIENFHRAVRSGNGYSLVMEYVQEFPELDLLETVFESGDNCLHIAVRDRNHDLIIFLLTAGISPNAKNTNTGDTALHIAVGAHDLKMATMLCKYGASVSTLNFAKKSPLDLASESDDVDLLELFNPGIQDLLSIHMASPRQSAVSDFRTDTERLESDAGLILIGSPRRTAADKKQQGTARNAGNAGNTGNAAADPFRAMKRANTKRALHDMKSLDAEEKALPALSGWLDRKSKLTGYKKQWVVVQNGYFLWNGEPRKIKNAKSRREREKFKGSLNLMQIVEIQPVTAGKTQRKFTFAVGAENHRKEYVWRCAAEKERDSWVDGLNQHRQHFYTSVVSYLKSK